MEYYDKNFVKMNKAFLNILEEKGIQSPKTLSEMTGIDKATISRQMSNKQSLSLSNIATYSKILKVPKGKFIEEYIPFYWVVGYVDRKTSLVSGRIEEDPKKVIFTNEYEKFDNEKILYDDKTQHLLRYNSDLSEKNIKNKQKLINTYVYVKTHKDYMIGNIGFLEEYTKTLAKIKNLSGEILSIKNYDAIYVITNTYNMKFGQNHIDIVDG